MEPIGSLQAGALHTEKVLQKLSEQVARLASAVANISTALEVRATRHDLRAASDINQTQFLQMQERLTLLERAVTVRTPNSSTINDLDPSTPVGLHVARLYAQLEATNEELAQRASSKSLAAIHTGLSTRLDEHAKIVSRERASQEQMTRMEQAHDALSSQVSAVEAACANKIDTARLAGLDITLSRLSDFATFRQSTESRLETLEQEASTLSLDLLERAAAAKKVETMVIRMRQQLRDDTPRNEDLYDLQQKCHTNLHTALANTSDTIESGFMHRITEINEHLNTEIKRNNTRLNKHDDVLVVHDEEIEKRATVLQMDLKTDLTEHEHLENTIREGLKRRAAVRTVRVVQKDLHDLIQKCAYLEKVSGLSQRFIEWFHNRGSVYEQNCQTIERQLNTLVVGSDPRVRQPFVNQVRLDSVGEVVDENGGGDDKEQYEEA